MKYQNRVASAIKPEIFQVPFIGGRALRIQLEQANLKLKELNIEIEADEQKVQNLLLVMGPLNTEADIDIKYRMDILTKLSLLQTAMNQCLNNIRTLEKNATLIQKQIQLEALEKIRKELETEIGKNNRTIGKMMEKIDAEKEKIEQYLTFQITQEAAVVRLAKEAGDDIILWKREYEKQMEQKSFVQLYTNNIGGEAIGLVMFDEAFNNMDDERIGGVLEFLRRLPLQIIIAAPPDKIQYIGPMMEETLLVMTDEKISYVEEYHNDAIQQAYS